MDKYEIITVISVHSLVEFQKKVKEFVKDKTIVRYKEGVSAVAVPTAKGIGVQFVPYAYIIHECTREEHEAWMFNQRLIQP